MKELKHTIIENLIYTEEFTKRVLPFIKSEYFDKEEERKVIDVIHRYTNQYGKSPTIEAILIDLKNDKSMSEVTEKNLVQLFSIVREREQKQPTLEWLIDKSEMFCKERAIYNGLMESIDIYQNKEKKSVGGIPDILKNALAVSFDNSIGHDYLDDFQKRYEYYHKPEYKIPYRLEYMNNITLGGLSRKTLNIALGGTHVGKTAHMCSLAADNLLLGNNVLYITLEMAEEEIAARIDANLLDVPLSEVKIISEEMFTSKVANLRKKTTGKLIIKEYPTATANVNHFRILLNELLLKQNFVPDVVYLDYLNLCTSARIRDNMGANSFTYYKSIAEELRGFAVEKNIALMTGSQFNRGSASSSDPSMDGVSESFGTVFTGDLIYALVATEDMIERGVVLLKQLKNRYDNMNRIPKFFLGFDRSKMCMYDIDDPTGGLINDNLVMDKTEYGQRDNELIKSGQKRSDFSGFEF